MDDLPGESGGSAGRRPVLRVGRHDASVLRIRGDDLLPNARESANDNHSSTSCPNNKKKRKFIGRVSLARENEAGAVGGRKSIFSMLTYRTSFCFWL